MSTSSPPPPSSATASTRRVPPPCWTPQETLALVEAYREKWFSVNRGNLRSSDWDEVAAVVSNSSVSDNPPKSSLQCRHKIEKLRKRYRMEKKRCLDFPGRFFSSWDLFPLLDAMAIGSSPGSKRCRVKDSADDFALKKFNSNNNSVVDEGFDPDDDLALDQDDDFIFRNNKYSRLDNNHSSSYNYNNSAPDIMNSSSNVNSVSVAFRPKDYASGRSVINGNFVSNRSNSNLVNAYVGFPLKSLGNVPTGFNPKIYTNADDRMSTAKFDHDLRRVSDERDRFVENVRVNTQQPPVFRHSNYSKINGSARFDGSSKVLNGVCDVKNSGVDDNDVEKAKDPLMELVSAIQSSTESFVKIEKMKMEMAVQFEKARMEMMLKHNQMILESQQQIMNTFAKAIAEKKEKRKKRKEAQYQDKNGDVRAAAANDCESVGKSGIAKEDCEVGSPES